LVQKSSRIEVYSALALPLLLHGSEIWTLRQKNKKQLTSVEMEFFGRTAGYTLLDCKRNEEILEELKVEPADETLRSYKTKLATTCNKNEQQRGAKNSAGL
jgi:hypothetical protein